MPSHDGKSSASEIHILNLICSPDPRVETDSRSDVRQSMGDKASVL